MRHQGYWIKKIVFGLVCLAVVLFLVAPVFFLVLASFSSEEYMTIYSKAWSLRWYEKFFSDRGYMDSFRLSIRLAVTTTAIALTLGTTAAYGIDRSPWKGFFLSVLLSPIMVPSIIIGISLLQFFAFVGLVKGFVSLLAGHVLWATPYVVRTVSAALYRFDVTLEEAALMAGANRPKTFWYVTLPILRPALLAGGCFAFIVSFGNTSISMFLTSAGFTTLPIRVFAAAEFSPDPIIAAISVVIVSVTLVTMLVVEKFAGIDRMFG